MVVVPAGSFMMGSTGAEIATLTKQDPNAATIVKGEGPQHTVTFAKPFAVGRFAVTFDEWDACVVDGGCKTNPFDEAWGRGNRPVIHVSWRDVTNDYLPWLNKKTGRSYRLLSEAEREYVTRAGTTSAFWWGQFISSMEANYGGNLSDGSTAKGAVGGQTLPVGTFAANPWGLYQVHGNVFEWVEDCWHDTYIGAPSDGSAWLIGCTDSGRRMIRGGSWASNKNGLRSAERSRYRPDFRFNFLGFRVARSLP